jgi:phosphoribosyl-AMP cyclohydrolase
MHETFIDGIRQRVPDAVVVLAKGSAIGDRRSPWGDIDFDVLVDDGEEYWPWWIDEDKSGTFTHISVAVASVESWLSGLDEPQDWAFGFPVSAPCRLIWARDESMRARFDRAEVRHPAGPPELEDTIESLGKARSALIANDPLRFWPSLHDIGRHAPTVLRAANPEVNVATRREALEAALALPNVPERWGEVISMCLGVDRHVREMGAALVAAEALVYGVVEIAMSLPEARLREAFSSWDVEMLSTGRLIRYLRRQS